MKCLFSALARAICLFVAVALLHGCGGGEAGEEELQTKYTEVVLSDEGLKLTPEALAEQLKSLDAELVETTEHKGVSVLRIRRVGGPTTEKWASTLMGSPLLKARVVSPDRASKENNLSASPQLRLESVAAKIAPIAPGEYLATVGFRMGYASWCGNHFYAGYPLAFTPQQLISECNVYLSSLSPQRRTTNYRLGLNANEAEFTANGIVYNYWFDEQVLGSDGVWHDGGWNSGGYIEPALSATRACPYGGSLTTRIEGRETTYVCVGGTPPQTAIAPPEITQSSCQAGQSTPNPIIPSSGEKTFRLEDINDQAAHPLGFERIYRTQWQIGPQARMGQLWAHNHSANLRRVATDATGNTLILQLADGSQRRFTRANATAAWTNTSHAAQLTAATTTAGAPAWRYTSAEDNSQWLFTQPTATAIGLLQSTRQRNGWTYVYAYNAAGQLTQVTNHFGRMLTLTYHATSGLLASVIQPDTRTTQYTWDASNRLTRVTHPDGRFVTHHHENTSFPQLITGITDENGLRYSTYTYDAQGRATRSTLGANIDTYTVAYSGTQPGFNTTATITDPIGTARSYGYAQTNGHTNVTSGSNLPGCKGEPPIATRIQNPTTGLLEQETDFKGNVTQYSWDIARMLPFSVTRGYATPLAQTTTTTWHPTFALPERITEPLRQTQFVYDTAGRLLSQTVTHTGGASNGKVQTTRYTYNAQGLLATRTEPNNAVTTFDQYSAAGLPQRITNPLGHIATLTYDGMGRPTQITQADGLVRTLTYDPRGRVLSSSAAASGTTLTTTYTYTPSGQVKTATMPDGHAITYSHDIAQRVTGWSDNRGQSATYTLDGLGNITNEQLRNNGGGIALQINRSVNAINRLASQTVGNVSTVNSYDANGQLQRVTDAANRSTAFTLDALNRVTQITDALGRAAQLGYNAQDAVTSARDFKGVQTSTTRDAQGNAGAEQTPDAGNSTTTFDSLGLPVAALDALGRATAITRDALGRPTRVNHSATTAAATGAVITSALTYDLTGTACNASGHANASKGRLCEMVDSVGGSVRMTTRFQWDSFGRLRQQTQILSSAITSHSTSLVTGYSYVASGAGAGQLANMTYPSGAVLAYQYNATGRLVGLTHNGQPLLQNIVYNALGQPLSWTWAFADGNSATSLTAARSHDSAGQLTSTELGSTTYNNLGQLQTIGQSLLRKSGTAWVAQPVTHSAGYDELERLKTFATTGHAEFQRSWAYSFDANGNRASSTLSVAGGAAQTTPYTTAADSNRLSRVSASTALTNAAGELTQIANRRLTYDTAGRLSLTGYTESGAAQRSALAEPAQAGPVPRRASTTAEGSLSAVLRSAPIDPLTTASGPAPAPAVQAIFKRGALLNQQDLAAAQGAALRPAQRTTPRTAQSKAGSLLQSEVQSLGQSLTKSTMLRTPVYRFYNSTTGAHFFTASAGERDAIIASLPAFIYEGAAFEVSAAAAAGLSPVYRFYNRSTGVHFYTISESEKNHLLANAPNMSLEGVVYHASTVAGAGFKPLYRFYLPAKGFHFYTASEAEKNSLVATAAATYTYEGPAYYVLGNNQAPTVNLTAPAAGASYTTPVSISISASADDVDGQVSKVDFYNGATLLGTVPGPTSSAASYNFTWANAPADTHTLTARATDSNGAVSASAALAITVITVVTLPPVVFGGPPTEHLYNGAAQRTVRVQPEQQSVYVYGQEGHTVLAEVQRNLSSNVLTTTEHIYLPTASGPMPVATVIAGSHYAVHTDHLGTPRRLTNSAGQPVWQWAFSGFGELPAQALPPAGQAAVSYNLRYPGQVDDGNGLFYNWHRFYDPGTGRYTSADPIGLRGGWNRFGYVGGNPLSFVDPDGLQQRAPPPRPNPNLISNVQANNLITQIQQINPQFRYPSVVSATGQGGYSSQDVQFLQTALQRVRPGGRLWPRTPQEMDQYLGTPGVCRPDLPGTPGRAKIIWQPSDNVRITFEQHPYHPTALSFHSGPHWHLDLPSVRHQTYVPTEPMP